MDKFINSSIVHRCSEITIEKVWYGRKKWVVRLKLKKKLTFAREYQFLREKSILITQRRKFYQYRHLLYFTNEIAYFPMPYSLRYLTNRLYVEDKCAAPMCLTQVEHCALEARPPRAHPHKQITAPSQKNVAHFRGIHTKHFVWQTRKLIRFRIHWRCYGAFSPLVRIERRPFGEFRCYACIFDIFFRNAGALMNTSAVDMYPKWKFSHFHTTLSYFPWLKVRCTVLRIKTAPMKW